MMLSTKNLKARNILSYDHNNKKRNNIDNVAINNNNDSHNNTPAIPIKE